MTPQAGGEKYAIQVEGLSRDEVASIRPMMRSVLEDLRIPAKITVWLGDADSHWESEVPSFDDWFGAEQV